MTLTRRTFLTAGRSRLTTLELSCEQLYMRYSDARAEGRLADFLDGLQRSIAAAGDVRLIAPEWLAQEDFEADVGPLLRASIQFSDVKSDHTAVLPRTGSVNGVSIRRLRN